MLYAILCEAGMLIVADENIPYAREAFRSLGEVQLMPGRAMNARALRNAEMLLVRSVTRVDGALLEGTPIGFVGTATIGTDHVDEDFVAGRGIRFAAAPGSNADSVAEYIVAALLVLARRRGTVLAGKRLGVVGVGNVGSRVAARARALGMEVALNDPPLARRTGDARYVPLDELYDCDVITLHVPLESGGPDPTRHLVNGDFLARMDSSAALINSSRGAVVDNGALLNALDAGRIADAVLDVWEGEPVIDTALLARTAVATPHIAGYSFDGKVNGTAMLYRAACAFLGVAPAWDAAAQMPPPEYAALSLDAARGSHEDVLREAVLTVYPIERDDRALRAVAQEPPAERGAFFDRLRRDYPVRREFRNTRITLANASVDTARALSVKLAGLGFSMAG